jgi:5-hydroxyisourate hydrolase
VSPITTHVLDTAAGRPASGVAVILERLDSGGDWREIAQAVTDADGRVRALLPEGELVAGQYRLLFGVEAYFHAHGLATFYHRVNVEFRVLTADEHYHVPLLVSPFGYSTYRGS